MKKIDLLIMRSLIGPFLVTFFVVVVFYVMQFFYTFIDDFVGKGLAWYVVAELIMYLSTNVIPLALPLAVLLASIMTFGALGEHYELTAMKAAGIPMLRFIRGSVIFTLFLALASLAFSNYILPVANLKFYTTLLDITQAKPALDIRENIFFTGFSDYVIKVDRKGSDNQHIYGVYIAHQGRNRANDDITLADSGLMFTSENRKYLVLKLFSGAKYERIKSTDKQIKPYSITHFDELEKVFDLSEFAFTRSNEDRLKNHYIMLNLSQLHYYIDSLEQKTEEVGDEMLQNMIPYFGFLRDAQTLPWLESRDLPFFWKLGLYPPRAAPAPGDSSYAQHIPRQERSVIFNRAIAYSKSLKDRIESPTLVRLKSYENSILKAKIEFHRKFMLAFSTLVLLFIGVSFGAIIRKGGIGYPVIFAVVFYVISYILLKVGETLALKSIVTPALGMWGGVLLMVPVAFFFTVKAKNDSAFLFMETYVSKFNKWKMLIKKWLS